MKQQAKALSLAYNFVANYCEYNQKQLIERLSLNKRTLMRMRLGQPVRVETFYYAIKVLYGIIDSEYMKDISENGGARSALFHKVNKELLKILFL